MALILGLDQGGSKTAAVVLDTDGNILGKGMSGGSNYISHGINHAMNSNLEACLKALAIAEKSLGDVDFVSAGLTGADWSEEYPILQKALSEKLNLKNVRVYNDCIIALRGGTDKGFGAVICAGTYLNVGVRSIEGEDYVFGYYVGMDYQGGHALGNNSLKAVFAAQAGIAAPTKLTPAFLEYFHTINVDELLKLYINGELNKECKNLAPIVLDFAGQSDEVAIKIVTDFGIGTANYVAAGLARFNMLDVDVDVVLSGSVFKTRHSLIRDVIASVISSKCPKTHIIDAMYEPVVGAGLLALDDFYSGKCPENILKNIHDSATAYKLLRK